MKTKLKVLLGFFTLTTFQAFGQLDSYNYFRPIEGIKEQWHKVIIPDDIYPKISDDFHDIRIFGITNTNDTIEAPYLLIPKADQVFRNFFTAEKLNATSRGNIHYLTFYTTDPPPRINQLRLEFKEKNFDYRLKLEGSQDQLEWFELINNYRVLSIQNELTDYHFTVVKFPQAEYRYYRFSINSYKKPKIKAAALLLNKDQEGVFKSFPLKALSKEENKKQQQSELFIKLPSATFISRLNLKIADNYDYYRPVSIQYLADSAKTEKGWHYRYETLSKAILSSVEEARFDFPGIISNAFKVIIKNFDNEPLTIDSIQLEGYTHELAICFTQEAKYFLAYGKPLVRKPNYDIVQFQDVIPEKLPTLHLGAEQEMAKKSKPVTPLFKHKWWLWGLMAIIIVILGYFSLRMIREGEG